MNLRMNLSTIHLFNNLKTIYFLMFIYFWEIECVHVQGRGRGRGWERISGCLCTVSVELDVGLNSTNCEIMTWAEINSRMLNWLSHPSAPSLFFNVFFIYFWERAETECEWVGGRERGRHRIPSRLQALSCQHGARCGARTHRPWDHDLSWSRTLNRLSHPGAPSLFSNVAEMSVPPLLPSEFQLVIKNQDAEFPTKTHKLQGTG